MDPKRFPLLLKAIYDAADELETMFKGRHFTPDGHMVGSIGEALAEYHYGLKLHAPSNKMHDGELGNRQVQIKATQGERIAISSCPEHLLVLKLSRDASFVEEYNGPGALVWRLVSHKKIPKNGQYQVSLAALRRLMSEVPSNARLPKFRL